MGVCTRHCRAEDMKQVLPRLAKPQAGLKGKEDNGGMLLETMRTLPIALMLDPAPGPCPCPGPKLFARVASI